MGNPKVDSSHLLRSTRLTTFQKFSMATAVIVLGGPIGLQYRESVTNMSCHNEKENKNSVHSSKERSYQGSTPGVRISFLSIH